MTTTRTALDALRRDAKAARAKARRAFAAVPRNEQGLPVVDSPEYTAWLDAEDRVEVLRARIADVAFTAS